ncbi:unnamed protein product, partial [Brachionus calyciflorus]
MRNSDNNNIEELKPIVDSLNYKYGHTSNEDLFVLGIDIGNSSDEDHFHLGFTSYSLLKQIELFKKGGVFHLDSTYKIIKYTYSLI